MAEHISSSWQFIPLKIVCLLPAAFFLSLHCLTKAEFVSWSKLQTIRLLPRVQLLSESGDNVFPHCRCRMALPSFFRPDHIVPNARPYSVRVLGTSIQSTATCLVAKAWYTFGSIMVNALYIPFLLSPSIRKKPD
ncbi:hypothetical protein F5141DRAFT_208687 [Pisolithus sp. B1]|nr:hypothetical protein F5141DRAFT_208687 [Pisolithus sp. B1]